MTLSVRPIATRGPDFKQFVELPYRIHGDLEHWVPVLRSDVVKLFDRKKNPFFRHAEVQPFLAERDDGGGKRVVGRITAIENRAHNLFHEDRVGFFGFFTCEEDPEAAAALFDAAAMWLSGRGLDTLRGPTNFSTNDDCGLLVRGFHRQVSLLMPYNPPYYEKLVEGAGFQKVKDLFAFWLEARTIPEKLDKAADLIERRRRARTRPLDMKRFDEELGIVRDIYNAAWEKNWGFVPMTSEELEHMARELKPVVEPTLVRIAEIDGEPIAFTVALPELNQVLQHLGGRLGPIELLKFLWYRRKVDALRVLTLGIKEGYRSSGVDVLMYRDLFKCGHLLGIWRGEFSWVLEDNIAMSRPLERMGAKIDRVYRLYERPIPQAGAAVLETS